MNDELLIELVRDNTVLYDKRDPKYLNVELKARIWRDIAAKVGVSGVRCKARWNNIRDNFRRSFVKRKSLSGGRAKKATHYRYEDQLRFLLAYMEEGWTRIGCRADPDCDGEVDQVDENLWTMKQEEEEDPERLSQSASPAVGSQDPATDHDMRSAADLVEPPREFIRRTPAATEVATLMRDLIENSRQARSSLRTPPTISLVNPMDLIENSRQARSSPRTPPTISLHNPMDLIENSRQPRSSPRTPPTISLDNPIDSFLFGISTTLKAFPPYVQHLAKSEIFTAVQRIEQELLSTRGLVYPGRGELRSSSCTEQDM